MGRLRGAEMRGSVYVYVCIYVYTGTSAGRRKLVDGWYSMAVLPARICCIVDLYADPTVNLLSIDLLQSLG